MIDLSQNKKPECVIGFDDNKIVYGTAGQKLTCQLEKMNTHLFDTDFVRIKWFCNVVEYFFKFWFQLL